MGQPASATAERVQSAVAVAGTGTAMLAADFPDAWAEEWGLGAPLWVCTHARVVGTGMELFFFIPPRR